MPRRPSLSRNLGFIAASALIAFGGFSGSLAESRPVLEFGTDGEALGLLEERGVHTTYTQVWAGAWLNREGWKGFEDLLRRVHQTNRTPMIQFFYWGNELNEDCFRNGCEGPGGLRKDQAGWDRMVAEMTPRLQAEFQGEPVVIVLETEFNKHLRQSEDLDQALAAKAEQLHAGYPQATIVLGFGNWGREDWPVFDRAAAASDEIGLQLMRGSRRDTPQMIRDAPNSLLDGAQEAQRLFHKPIFVSDVALSSHGGPQYEQAQADAIRGLFELAPRLREAGVHAIVYRSILDNPSADTSDYYGEAEKHFGLVWTTNRTTKPAFEALVDALTTDAEPAVRPPELATNSRQDDGPLAGLPFDGVETLASDLEAPRADAVPPPWSADLLAQAAAT